MRFFFDLLVLALVLPVLFMLAYQNGLLDGVIDDDMITADPFIRAELAQTTSGADLSRRIDTALDAGDFDDAMMYSEIATYMDMPIERGTAERLTREQGTLRTAARNTGSFFEGFVTGEGSNTAAFVGAVSSDLTVIGDVRDIGEEGGKMIIGEDYSKLILGLSVIGLGATTATVATGGAALPTKVGISLLKVAKKAGMLTAEFTAHVGKLLGDALHFDALRDVLKTTDLANIPATREAVTRYTRSISAAPLQPLFSDLAVLEKNVGPADTVRLMRHVKSGDDVANLTKMSGKLGNKTRGVVELTGKTSLRAFKTVSNLILWALGWGWAVVAAIGTGILGSIGSRLTRRRG